MPQVATVALALLACGGRSEREFTLNGESGSPSHVGGTSSNAGGTSSNAGGASSNVGGGASSGTAGVAGAAATACAEIAFSDAAVERSVRGQLAVPDGPIPPERAAVLESLTVVNASSFGGIECLSSLRTLYANLGWAFEAEPIGALTRLQTLSLESHSFYTLDPLANLQELVSLDLRESLGLAGLKPIGEITSLRDLDISQNGAVDLHSLASLTGIVSLNMNGTSSGDYGQGSELLGLGALAGMTELSTLLAENSELEDLSPLAGLSALDHLDLSANHISDLSPLAGASALLVLDLGLNRVESAAPLAGLRALTSLDLSSNPLSDLTPLRDLTELGALMLYETDVSDLSPLAALTKLGYVSLGRTRVTDLSPLLALVGPRDDCPRLYLEDAPLDANSLEFVIPELCAAGWIVHWTGAEGVIEECWLDACIPPRP